MIDRCGGQGSAVPADWQELLHGYPGYRTDDLNALTQQITVR